MRVFLGASVTDREAHHKSARGLPAEAPAAARGHPSGTAHLSQFDTSAEAEQCD
jgi:hypothetical protein